MRLDREGRRTVAQFLNGIAVAVVATMLIAPIAGGNVNVAMVLMGAASAITLHAVALLVSAER